MVITQNQVACRLPEYFSNPNTFVPERWLRSTDGSKRESVNPYLVLPFGHGPRSCIARRFAEQNIQVFLLRVRISRIAYRSDVANDRYNDLSMHSSQICRASRFTWCGDSLDVMSLLINKPDAPIRLKFENTHA